MSEEALQPQPTTFKLADVPRSEMVALGCAILMLIGFLVLPWTDIYVDGEAKMDTTALNLALSGPDVELLKPARYLDQSEREPIVMVGDDEYVPISLSTLEYLAIFAIPVAAVGGAAITIAGLLQPEKRTKLVLARRVIGLSACLYFFFLYGPYGVVGIGFWLTALSAVLMVVVAPPKDSPYPFRIDFGGNFSDNG
jgi:hypothetical protein